MLLGPLYVIRAPDTDIAYPTRHINNKMEHKSRLITEIIVFVLSLRRRLFDRSIDYYYMSFSPSGSIGTSIFICDSRVRTRMRSDASPQTSLPRGNIQIQKKNWSSRHSLVRTHSIHIARPNKSVIHARWSSFRLHMYEMNALYMQPLVLYTVHRGYLRECVDFCNPQHSIEPPSASGTGRQPEKGSIMHQKQFCVPCGGNFVFY